MRQLQQVGQPQARRVLRQPRLRPGEAGELAVGGRQDHDLARRLAEIDRSQDIGGGRLQRAQEVHEAAGVFEIQRQARGHEPDPVGHGGEPLVQAAGMVDEIAAQRTHRDDAEADLVRHQHHRPRQRRQRREQLLGRGGRVTLRHHQVGQPQGEAVDQDRALRPRLLDQGLRQVQRRLDRMPGRTAPLAMVADARSHLAVQRLGRGDVDRRQARLQDERLGMRALARARAAENEGQSGQGAGQNGLQRARGGSPGRRNRAAAGAL